MFLGQIPRDANWPRRPSANPPGCADCGLPIIKNQDVHTQWSAVRSGWWAGGIIAHGGKAERHFTTRLLAARVNMAVHDFRTAWRSSCPAAGPALVKPAVPGRFTASCFDVEHVEIALAQPRFFQRRNRSTGVKPRAATSMDCPGRKVWVSAWPSVRV